MRITSYFLPASNSAANSLKFTSLAGPSSSANERPAFSAIGSAKSAKASHLAAMEASPPLPFQARPCTPTKPCLSTNERATFAAGRRMPFTSNDFMTRNLTTSMHIAPPSSHAVHVCRICYGTFGSNNGLHRHLRASHGSPTPRRTPGLVASGRS